MDGSISHANEAVLNRPVISAAAAWFYFSFIPPALLVGREARVH